MHQLTSLVYIAGVMVMYYVLQELLVHTLM